MQEFNKHNFNDTEGIFCIIDSTCGKHGIQDFNKHNFNDTEGIFCIIDSTCARPLASMEYRISINTILMNTSYFL